MLASAVLLATAFIFGSEDFCLGSNRLESSPPAFGIFNTGQDVADCWAAGNCSGEWSFVTIAKNIEVFNASKGIQTSHTTVGNFVNFIEAKNSILEQASGKIKGVFWLNRDRLLNSLIRIWRVSYGRRIRKNIKASKGLHLQGWSSSKISNSDLNYRTPIFFYSERLGVNDNISAQLYLGAFFGICYKITCRSIKKHGGDSKNYGESGDKESADSDNFFTKIAYRGADDNETDFDRRAKGGAIFFGGVCILMIIIGWLICVITR